MSYTSNDPFAYAIKIKGKFLEPKVISGEYIVIEPSIAYQGYDDVLIVRNDETYEVKVWVGEIGGYFRFLDVNQIMKSEVYSIPADEISKILYIAAIVKPQRKT